MSDADQLEYFSRQWRNLCARLDIGPAATDDLLAKLTAAYTENGRHYHNIEHINQLLALFTKHYDKIEDPNTFLLAIYFHDYIYVASREKQSLTNEENSAEAAAKELEQLGLGQGRIQRLKQFILATQRHQDAGDEQVNLFLDMDLSILASSRDVYKQYAANIRREYSVYNDEEYTRGRIQFLDRMIQREHIFLTADFQKQYDNIAFDNLRRELEKFETRALYAGSFDPITRGHMGIIAAAASSTYDKLYVGIGFNPDKKTFFFSPQERVPLIETAINEFVEEALSNPKEKPTTRAGAERIKSGEVQIIVTPYTGYTIDFAKKHNVHDFIRGIRQDDAAAEAKLAHGNMLLSLDRNWPLTTKAIFTPDPRYIFASSSIIRELSSAPLAIEEYLYSSTASAVAERVKEIEIKEKLAKSTAAGAGK